MNCDILPSVCPAIWLIELDKLDSRLAIKEAREAFLNSNMTTIPPTTPSDEPENITFNTTIDLSVLSDVGVGHHTKIERSFQSKLSILDTSGSGQHSNKGDHRY